MAFAAHLSGAPLIFPDRALAVLMLAVLLVTAQAIVMNQP